LSGRISWRNGGYFWRLFIGLNGAGGCISLSRLMTYWRRQSLNGVSVSGNGISNESSVMAVNGVSVIVAALEMRHHGARHQLASAHRTAISVWHRKWRRRGGASASGESARVGGWIMARRNGASAASNGIMAGGAYQRSGSALVTAA
jgi:hypothetical protein